MFRHLAEERLTLFKINKQQDRWLCKKRLQENHLVHKGDLVGEVVVVDIQTSEYTVLLGCHEGVDPGAPLPLALKVVNPLPMLHICVMWEVNVGFHNVDFDISFLM